MMGCGGECVATGRWASEILVPTPMTAGKKARLVLLWLLICLGWAWAEPVVVGSKAFPEGRLLSEIVAQTIENKTGLKVERRLGLGGTSVCFDAMRRQEIDVYVEYSGTGTMLLGSPSTGNPLKVFLETDEAFQRRFGIKWMRPFGFEDSYALAVPAELAERLQLRTISDLKRHSAEIRAGLTHEFLNREDGWKGLAEHYDLQLKVVGLEHGLAYPAIASGAINLMDAYTTDARLERLGLVTLADNHNFFPPYEAAPVVRQQLLQQHPEIEEALESLAFTIDEATMRRLNAEIELNGRTEAEVARNFLAGLKIEVSPAEQAQRHDLTSLLFSAKTWELTRRHLYLTLGVTLAVALVGVPLGVLLAHNETAAKAGFAAIGFIQTLPSLALLAILVPFLGLGLVAPCVALFLYGMLPILRNTYHGVKTIDPNLMEAARALGLTRFERMRRIEIPLAALTIMAGIRIAAVISVRIATVAAVAGAGGFGEPILLGMQLGNVLLVLSGAIPAAVLAVAVDQLLALVETTIIQPRSRRGQPP